MDFIDLKLFDAAGRRVAEASVLARTRSAVIDLRSVPAGVYFLSTPREQSGLRTRLVRTE